MRGLRVWVLIGVAAVASGAVAQERVWGGPGCAEAEDLRALVDSALAATPFGAGRGSGAPGYSVALQHDECGRFAYAAGLRRVQGRKPNQISTRQHIGSMTKPVTGALTLILAEQGLLGPRGIDAKVAGFFSRAERRELTKGTAASDKRCPVTLDVLDRDAAEPSFVQVRAKCGKLKKITLRQLLNGNHGLLDFVNEVDRNSNGFVDNVEFFLGDLVAALGVDRLPTPPAADAFEALAATGLLASPGAKRGGTRLVDFEVSFGNTGYQLLGLILERVSGKSFDQLVDKHIVSPLGLDPMSLATAAPKKPAKGKLASEYAITSGATDAEFEGLDESLFGAYPLVDINGHLALDIFEGGPFVFSNGGGGAGALAAAPDSYVRFFHALITGGLLSQASQAELEAGFVELEGLGFEHGFALFRSSGPLGVTVSKGGQTAGSGCQTVHSLAAQGGSGVTAVACRNSLDLFLPSPATVAEGTAPTAERLAIDLLVAARP